MARATRPVSLRLAPHHIQQLKARAFTVSGTLTGVARELILTGLAGGDNKALAERLMEIERRLVTLESLARDVSGTAERIEAVAKDPRHPFRSAILRGSDSYAPTSRLARGWQCRVVDRCQRPLIEG